MNYSKMKEKQLQFNAGHLASLPQQRFSVELLSDKSIKETKNGA